jgi:hypothetical protein
VEKKVYPESKAVQQYGGLTLDSGSISFRLANASRTENRPE